MREGTAGFGSLVAAFLVFSFLMIFMVPQMRGIVPQGQLGLVESLSKLTGVAPYWIIGAFMAGIIALGTQLILYLYGTGKLSELL